MRSETVPLSSLESAAVRIDFTGGRLDVGSLSSGSDDLAEMDYEVTGGHSSLDMDLLEREGTGELRLVTAHTGSSDDTGIDWRIDLTPNIPLSISVRSAASGVDLDLRRLQVVDLTLSLDAGSCDVRLPSSAGFTSVGVDVNVANVEIEVPDGVAARIQVEGGLSLISVDEGRFPRDGDYFQSPDYETVANRIDMVIECDVGRVKVK